MFINISRLEKAYEIEIVHFLTATLLTTCYCFIFKNNCYHDALWHNLSRADSECRSFCNKFKSTVWSSYMACIVGTLYLARENAKIFFLLPGGILSLDWKHYAFASAEENLEICKDQLSKLKFQTLQITRTSILFKIHREKEDNVWSCLWQTETTTASMFKMEAELVSMSILSPLEIRTFF